MSLNTVEIKTFIADKVYDTNKIRRFLKEHEISACIPNKRNRKIKHNFDKTIYKWRNRVERLFQRIKENRRLAMRFDKLDITFAAFIALALIKIEVC